MIAMRSLAAHGNMRVAAELCAMSPSSFSRYIQQAEDYVGQELFERVGKSFRTTPAGRAFLNMLDNLDEALVNFETNADRLRHLGPGSLNIGCGPLAARTIVAPLLKDLMNAYSDIRAKVIVRTNKEPLESLRTGALDLAICDLTHTPDLSDLEIHMVRKRETSFWARPEHPLCKKDKVHVSDIFRSKLGTGSFPNYWRKQLAHTLGDTVEAHQIVANMPQIECDDFMLLAAIAMSTDLVVGGMASDFHEYEQLGLLKHIKTVEPLTWNICIARRKGASFPALDLVWNRLHDAYDIIEAA